MIFERERRKSSTQDGKFDWLECCPLRSPTDTLACLGRATTGTSFSLVGRGWSGAGVPPAPACPAGRKVDDADLRGPVVLVPSRCTPSVASPPPHCSFTPTHLLHVNHPSLDDAG